MSNGNRDDSAHLEAAGEGSLILAKQALKPLNEQRRLTARRSTDSPPDVKQVMVTDTLETFYRIAVEAAPRVWALFLLFILAEPLTPRQTRKTILGMYSRLRIRHLLPVFWVIPLTATAYAILTSIFPPLRYSWISALEYGAGQAASGASGSGTNLMIAPVTLPVVGPLLLILLILNMPLLTALEERIFRAGTRSYLHAVPKSLAFGMVHCLVGVPLAAGLALAIPGFWFSHRYLKANGSQRVYHRGNNRNAPQDRENGADFEDGASSPAHVLWPRPFRTLRYLWLRASRGLESAKRDAVTSETVHQPADAGLADSALHHTCYNLVLLTLIATLLTVAAVT